MSARRLAERRSTGTYGGHAVRSGRRAGPGGRTVGRRKRVDELPVGHGRRRAVRGRRRRGVDGAASSQSKPERPGERRARPRRCERLSPTRRDHRRRPAASSTSRSSIATSSISNEVVAGQHDVGEAGGVGEHLLVDDGEHVVAPDSAASTARWSGHIDGRVGALDEQHPTRIAGDPGAHPLRRSGAVEERSRSSALRTAGQRRRVRTAPGEVDPITPLHRARRSDRRARAAPRSPGTRRRRCELRSWPQPMRSIAGRGGRPHRGQGRGCRPRRAAHLRGTVDRPVRRRRRGTPRRRRHARRGSRRRACRWWPTGGRSPSPATTSVPGRTARCRSARRAIAVRRGSMTTSLTRRRATACWTSGGKWRVGHGRVGAPDDHEPGAVTTSSGSADAIVAVHAVPRRARSVAAQIVWSHAGGAEGGEEAPRSGSRVSRAAADEL